MALLFLINTKAHSAHQSFSILLQQSKKNTAGNAELFKFCYFCLGKANYMKLRTLASYLRNWIIMVIKSALLCTAVISCRISRGPWVEWGSPALTSALTERETSQRKGVDATRVQKILVKPNENWPLRRRLLASYDLYFSQLAIVPEHKKKLQLSTEEYLLKNTPF